jgi:hypothetical protein
MNTYLIEFAWSFNGQYGEGQTFYQSDLPIEQVKDAYLQTVRGDDLGKYETVYSVKLV